MKKLLILITALLIMTASNCVAQEIDVNEARPAVTKYKITDVIFHQVTKQAIVVISKGYLDGEEFVYTGEKFTVVFQNTEDDPETAEDETNNEYNNFISFIEIDPAKLKTAVRTKLDI